MHTAKVIKDDFFATKKWFIVLNDGYKVNTVGFKTKKAAVAAVEDAGWVAETYDAKFEDWAWDATTGNMKFYKK